MVSLDQLEVKPDRMLNRGVRKQHRKRLTVPRLDLPYHAQLTGQTDGLVPGSKLIRDLAIRAGMGIGQVPAQRARINRHAVEVDHSDAVLRQDALDKIRSSKIPRTRNAVWPRLRQPTAACSNTARIYRARMS